MGFGIGIGFGYLIGLTVPIPYRGGRGFRLKYGTVERDVVL